MTVGIQYFVEYAFQEPKSAYDIKYHEIGFEVSDEEYIILAEQAKEHGRVLNNYSGQDAEAIVKKIEDWVKDIDRFYTTQGKYRDKPLKKARDIENIGLELTDRQMREFYSMKDTKGYLSLPASEVTIFRKDGSNVKIKYEQGTVKLYDSKKKGQHSEMYADDFIRFYLNC